VGGTPKFGVEGLGMTSDQIAKATEECDRAWPSVEGPLMNFNMPTDVAAYRASLEVAYQLAILNEQIGGVLNSRIPQFRVMVEPGEWPIQVQEQKR
jgi:hypothetical protein